MITVAVARELSSAAMLDIAAAKIAAMISPMSPIGMCSTTNVAFRLRMIGAVSYAKLAGAAGLLAVFALGGGLSALWVMALATLVLAALCALETLEPA